jgi:hypothetical protein
MNRRRQKMKPYFLPVQTAKKDRQSLPFFGEKAREPQGGPVLRCFLQGLKAGFAHLQTQINPAKSRVLLFDEHIGECRI